ncbi:hypothetical protein IEQ34_012025 [Dendrobium chrysotoxum]|uniref:Uncharacterized protein n=1 Tax=Dendrobium chrysotoxum TaxID=161865 RepID=A0AAV7GRD0_DENCH|nr:hypothetical protein IEQ34_012025 [Dendrobium chrysotoxum]
MAMQTGLSSSKVLILMGAGLTGSIILRNGRLSDVISELQELFKRVNEAEVMTNHYDASLLAAQCPCGMISMLLNKLKRLAGVKHRRFCFLMMIQSAVFFYKASCSRGSHFDTFQTSNYIQWRAYFQGKLGLLRVASSCNGSYGILLHAVEGKIIFLINLRGIGGFKFFSPLSAFYARLFCMILANFCNVEPAEVSSLFLTCHSYY